MERGLDPLTTKLVVADPDRTDKTICLAVTPAMKKLGVRNRCRVFEIPDSIDYIMATPRMQLYIDYSAKVYSVYLKFISKDDIHVYSIDEAFMDVTEYLDMYGMEGAKLGKLIMEDIYATTGITATCGVGTNLYLAKIALDITAKHSPDNIGILDEKTYMETLWDHKPITDFWRIGPGISRRLAGYGLYTMRDVAQADENMLYHMFGIDAELLIDHSKGRETTTISDIKKYTPRHTGISGGQVLPEDYDYEKGKLIVKEMADLLSLDLIDKRMVTQSVTLYIGYSGYLEVEPARGSVKLDNPTNSGKKLVEAVEHLYDKVMNPGYTLRRVNISFNDLQEESFVQYDLFTDPEETKRERDLARAMIDVKKKYGKNAIIKGMNLKDGAKTIERNKQIGGHRSGND